MRFAVVVAALVSVAAAQSTTYITEKITITSCAPTVTNCPAHSTVTSTTSYPAPVTTNSSIYVAPANSTKAVPTLYMPPPPPPPAAVVTPSVVTVTITVNTCPVTTSAAIVVIPTKAASSPVVPPSASTGLPVPVVKNSTSVTTSSPPKFTGAASSLSGSVVVAGLAGLAAVVLAA